MSSLATREEWLINAAVRLSDIVHATGAKVPPVAVSIGFPHRRGGLSNRLGECWAGQVAADGRPAVFISPVLGDPLRILDVLLHELIHAAVGVEHGHRGRFVTVARACGLEGRPTATVAGRELRGRLNSISESLGALPHAALRPTVADAAGVGSRLRLYVCPCDVRVRVASDHFEATCNECGGLFGRGVPGRRQQRRR